MPSLVKDETEPVSEGAQPGDDLLNHPDFKSTLENAKHEFSKTKLKVIRKYQPWKLEAGKEGREKFKRNERERQDPHGAVYLGHIPHGFFEKQIESFFSQFGRVTRVNLARSKKTGRNKGYAFVEFDHPEVAKVVAETMNNYLLFERLLKAQYVPPEKIHKGMFPDKSFEDGFCPTIKRRIKQVKLQDEAMTPEEVEKNRKRIQKTLKATLGKLKDLGIDYQPQVFDPPTDELPDLALSQKRKHVSVADNEPKSKKNKKLKKEAKKNEPKEVSDALEKTEVKPRPFIAKKLKETKKKNDKPVLQSEPANTPTEVVEPIIVAEKAFTLGTEVASPKKSSQKRQKWKKNKKAAALATLTEATQPNSVPESVAELESAAPKKKKKKNRKTRQAQNGANVEIVAGEVSEVAKTESGTEKAKKKRKKKSGKKSAPEN